MSSSNQNLHLPQLQREPDLYFVIYSLLYVYFTMFGSRCGGKLNIFSVCRFTLMCKLDTCSISTTEKHQILLLRLPLHSVWLRQKHSFYSLIISNRLHSAALCIGSEAACEVCNKGSVHKNKQTKKVEAEVAERNKNKVKAKHYRCCFSLCDLSEQTPSEFKVLKKNTSILGQTMKIH